MKRIGVLGGMSAQATMDFEARVHRVSQKLIPQDWGRGYPPMVVWFHRAPPLCLRDDGSPVVPMELEPSLLEAAAWLGKGVDFLVVPCNTAHIWLRELTEAAGCPVLSMIEVTLDEIGRRGWRRVGVLGFHAAPPVYVDPLRGRGIRCETIDATLQGAIDEGIRAVMEGREGPAETGSARTAVRALRAASVDGIVLGCTEIPLLLGRDGEADDLVNPAAVLAAAAVRLALA
jgi:aspartate racemase